MYSSTSKFEDNLEEFFYLLGDTYERNQSAWWYKQNQTDKALEILKIFSGE